MEWVRKSTCSVAETQYGNRCCDPAMLEEQQIRQAQSGNLEAFNELVLAYQESVFRQAFWLLGDEAAAEDTCQEAFLLAYRNIHTFHGGPFRPWIMRIVTNRCIDLIRAGKRYPSCQFYTVDEDGEEIEPYWLKDSSDSPEKVIERAETGEAIRRSIQKLAPKYRVPILLVDLQEMDYSEASAVLKIPLGTFKSRLSRARQKLREDLFDGKNSHFGGKYVEHYHANANFEMLPGAIG